MKNSIITRFITAIMTTALTVTAAIPMMPLSASAAETLTWPVPGHTTLSQGYHDGKAIDISDGSIAGADVVAAEGGTVKKTFRCGTQHYGSTDYYGCGCYGFGTGVVILGDDGRYYQYAHMQADSIPSSVTPGARVEKGTIIGKVGTTGNSTGVHLHFGISTGNWWNESGINPEKENYDYGYEAIPDTGTDGGNSTGSSSATASWRDEQCSPSSNDAYLQTHVYMDRSGHFSEAGIVIKDMNGNVIGHKEERAEYDRSDMKIWYNVQEELGVALTPGTTYTYTIYCVFDGETFYTTPAAFTTMSADYSI